MCTCVLGCVLFPLPDKEEGPERRVEPWTIWPRIKKVPPVLACAGNLWTRVHSGIHIKIYSRTIRYPEEGLNYCSQGLGGLPCCSVGLAVAVAC